MGGRVTRGQQSYVHNSDNKSRSRHFGDALEPAESLSRNTAEAQLIPRAGAGFKPAEPLVCDQITRQGLA